MFTTARDNTLISGFVTAYEFTWITFIMDRSKPVFHAISVVILLIVIVLYWNSTSELTNVDGNLGSDERATTSLPLLNEHLVWMIPVLFIAILVSVVSAFILEECLRVLTK